MNAHRDTMVFEAATPNSQGNSSQSRSYHSYHHYQHHHTLPAPNTTMSAAHHEAQHTAYHGHSHNHGHKQLHHPSSSVSHPYHYALDNRDLSSLQSISMSPPPLKGKRKRASPQQLEILNKVFANTSFPPTDMRNSLARELGMTPRTVQIWFQNKRQASRQRDGNHSRNTKSMAGPGTGIMKGSRSLSPLSESEHNRGSASPSVSSSQSSSPTVGYSPLTSGHPQQQQQQQHQLMALVAAAAATTSSPSESRNNSDGGMTAATTPVWKSEPRAAIAKPANSGYITASALGGLHVQYSYYDKNYEHQQPKQKSGARSIVNKLPSLSSLPSAGMDLGDLDHKRRESSSSQYVANGHSSSQPLHKLAEFTDKGVRMSNDRQFAHTRNDMWFNRTAPSNLEYLYRNDHQQQQLPRMVHPCVDRPAAEVAALNTNVDELSSMPASHTPRNVSVHRSMSLMDMLNAPPEQRKLPPLPPIGQ